MKSKRDLNEKIKTLRAQNRAEVKKVFAAKDSSAKPDKNKSGSGIEQGIAQGMTYAQYALSAYKLINSLGGSKLFRKGKIVKMAGLVLLTSIVNYLIQNPEIISRYQNDVAAKEKSPTG